MIELDVILLLVRLSCSPASDRDRRFLVQSGAEGEQQRLEVGERHAVCVPRVTTDFGDETVLVLCAGLEPAFAMKHLFHDSSHRTYEGPSTSGQDGGNPTAMWVTAEGLPRVSAARRFPRSSVASDIDNQDARPGGAAWSGVA